MIRIVASLLLLLSLTSAQLASDFKLTGWYSDMLVNTRAGLNGQEYLCQGTFAPVTDGPTFDGTGKTCYMNPIAASFRDPTVMWFHNGNGLDTGAPGFTIYAVAFLLENHTDYWPTCDANGVCTDCSKFDPVRQGWDTATDNTCAVLGSNKLCTSTNFYEQSWNVSDCAIVTTVTDTSGVMMASWEQVSGFATSGVSSSVCLAGLSLLGVFGALLLF